MCWDSNRLCYFDDRRRQHQRKQQRHSTEETRQENFTTMASGWSKISPIIPLLVCFLLVSSSICPAVHASKISDRRAVNQTFHPEQELKKLKNIKARLRKINKPALKTFQA